MSFSRQVVSASDESANRQAYRILRRHAHSATSGMASSAPAPVAPEDAERSRLGDAVGMYGRLPGCGAVRTRTAVGSFWNMRRTARGVRFRRLDSSGTVKCGSMAAVGLGIVPVFCMAQAG